MSSQVSMFATVEDMRALLSHANELGARAFPSVVATDSRPTALSFSACAEQQDGGTFLLLPASLAPVEIFYIPFSDDPEHAQVDTSNSPVLVVDTCEANEEALFNGRLFLGNDPSDSRHVVARKLYNDLAKTVKAWPKTPRFGIHVGPDAVRRARAGALKLRHHAVTLVPPP